MAALDTPWTFSMSDEPSAGADSPTDLYPPTFASFAPPTSSPAARSTFQVHQKSPLLVATPPQVTRALSQAFPYLAGLNWLAGLLTWTTPDPWESFLVVATFWAVVLYGDVGLRYGGNVLAVALLILCMFARRHHGDRSTTLDEILETLSTLTARVNMFFEPFLQLTRFLSTTVTPTTTTTGPALTTLFARILLTTPLWLALSVYPFHIITTRRVVLATGTLVLSWHSRPAEVSRTILWRSALVRALASAVTGLTLTPLPPPPALPPRNCTTTTTNTTSTPLTASTTGASPGVKFTFAIYENQRRWLGVGWTASLLTYERAPFTDEHLQACLRPEEFELPEAHAGSGVVWRWVAASEWRVDKGGGDGWVYYDNKWRDGRRGVDGWGKYTRRRKWVRDAELVEDCAMVEEVVGEKKEKGEKEEKEEKGKEERRTEHDEDEGEISTDEAVPEAHVLVTEQRAGGVGPPLPPR